MQKLHPSKYRMREITAIVLAVFGVIVWHNTVLTYDGPSLPTVRESIGVPVRITIPSIALDAAIEEVALASDGSMDVPKHPLDTGWYALGPRPGAVGSATIDGHVSWLNGATAVFANLNKVQPGDVISVEDDKGRIISFMVRQSRMYDAAADATSVFSSNDGKAHLNIITCDGVWDTHTKQYSKRLVVFSERVD